MPIVWSTIILMLILQMNLANSQSTNCSVSSNNCVTPLTSNFTKDCNTGRLSDYAQCLSNGNCLNSGTANVHLNAHYCGEGGCSISCQGKVCCMPFSYIIYAYRYMYLCTYICMRIYMLYSLKFCGH